MQGDYQDKKLLQKALDENLRQSYWDSKLFKYLTETFTPDVLKDAYARANSKINHVVFNALQDKQVLSKKLDQRVQDEAYLQRYRTWLAAEAKRLSSTPVAQLSTTGIAYLSDKWRYTEKVNDSIKTWTDFVTSAQPQQPGTVMNAYRNAWLALNAAASADLDLDQVMAGWPSQLDERIADLVTYIMTGKGTSDTQDAYVVFF